MSLDAWEEHVLTSIADDLIVSSPALASRLSVFNRLAFGEQMPENLQAKGEVRREHYRARPRRRGWLGRARQAGRPRGLLAHIPGRGTWPAIFIVGVFIVVTATTIGLALTVGNTGTSGHTPARNHQAVSCPQIWPLACVGQ